MLTRILLSSIFLLSANSTLAADKVSPDSTLALQQQVVELQKEVVTLRLMLEQVIADQRKQQSYIQPKNNELVIDGAKQVTISAKDQLVLKAGDASIQLKKNGEIFLGGDKFNAKQKGDVAVKGSKTAEN